MPMTDQRETTRRTRRWRLTRTDPSRRNELLPLCARCGRPVLPAEQLETQGTRAVFHRECDPPRYDRWPEG